jgi:NitT/TauT family transport system ATP-binding protein
MAVLSIHNIALGYENNGKLNTILHRTSFNVAQGKITCVLGSSGVGKSSLLRVIAGLDKPISGEVQLFGETISTPHPEIGFVFQSANILPWLNVKKNVAFGLDFACRQKLSKNEINQRVQAAINEVGLENAANSLPNELSGGMAQRVNLARAIAREPKLILLDEPFSALDPIIRSQMQHLLHQIVQHHQASAVMITHDIDEALAIADQIILLGAIPNEPATIVGKWHIASPFPRHNLLSLNEIRVDILRTLQNAQAQKRQEQTVDYEI